MLATLKNERSFIPTHYFVTLHLNGAKLDQNLWEPNGMFTYQFKDIEFTCLILILREKNHHDSVGRTTRLSRSYRRHPIEPQF